MANALKRTIEENEVVVVDEKYVKPEYAALESRLFKCTTGGFGMSPATMGTSISGEWLDGSGKDRIRGYWISPEDTKKY